jgi:spore coat polysaccharide biosynthesis protein SpsF
VIVGVIQARMGSTRVPGKVMADLCGAPMIDRIFERVSEARTVDTVGVATTTQPSDDPLAEHLARRGVGCHRGEVDDIVGRLCGAAREFGADVLVRLWGDCPFADPGVIDGAVDKLLAEGLDYASNFRIDERTFPAGLELEVYRRAALEQIDRGAGDPFYREFPAEYLAANPELFRTGVVRCEEDLSNVPLTVDYPQDLEAARAIYERLYRPGEIFGFREVVSLIREDRELTDGRAGLARNAEYLQKKKERQ